MNERVLVVDDDPSVRSFLENLLRKQYQVVTAANGGEALALAMRQMPAIVLLDIMMDGIDGYETCRCLKSQFFGENIQVIMVSAASSPEEQLCGFEHGADGYLVKPIDAQVLLSEVRLHLQLREAINRVASIETELQSNRGEIQRLMEERTRNIIATQNVAVFALAKVAESRDDETGEHLVRVRLYSQILAEHLARDSVYAAEITTQFLDDLQRASPLHDIGKVAVRDAILLKPGRLTPEEFELMKMHTVLGANTLEEVVWFSQCGSFLATAVAIARFHHERFNGTGYPQGLQGQEIPLAARIVALADVFDALTSTRPYKPAYSAQVARRIIGEESGKQFDPEIVAAFEACFEEFRVICEGNRDQLPKTAWAMSATEDGQGNAACRSSLPSGEADAMAASALPSCGEACVATASISE